MTFEEWVDMLRDVYKIGVWEKKNSVIYEYHLASNLPSGKRLHNYGKSPCY